MAEEDTWKPRKNLENAEDLVKEFKKEYGEGIQKKFIGGSQRGITQKV